jgi:hypothetical protein
MYIFVKKIKDMYKTNKNIIALFVGAIVTILSISCSGNSSKQKVKESKKIEKAYKYASMKDGVLHLDLNEARKHPKEVKLSDICDSLIYIPLETKKSSLVQFISRAHIDGDDLFFQDGWKLLHFNINGKFLGQLGKTGRGPGEYICGGLCLDSENNKVYTKATFRNRIYEFDYNNKFISGKLKCNECLSSLCFNKKNNSIVGPSWYLFAKGKKVKYNIITEVDCENNKKTVLPSKYFPKKFFLDNAGVRFCYTGSSVYSYNDMVYFQEIANDTVFCKTENKLDVHLIMNNKDFVPAFDSSIDVSSEAIKNGSAGKIFYVKAIGESSNCVFLRDWYSPYSFIYDKKNRELICNNINGKDKPLLYNDFDGVIDFKSFSIVNNKYLCKAYQAVDVLELVEGLSDDHSKYAEQLKRLAANLTEESNPVILLARLKK